MLKFATVREHLTWIVTDATRRCIVARRLDGIEWEHSTSKAYMFAGSQGNHLIGGHEAESAMFVLLVEGTPDLLAAFQAITSARVHAKEFRAVCMPAASGRLTQEDCALLKRAKLVCIIRHRDAAGEAGARRWNSTLHERCVRNVICDLKTNAKDLNDFVQRPQFDAQAFVAAVRTATCEKWGER